MIHALLNEAEMRHFKFEHFTRPANFKAKKDRLGKPPNRSMSGKESERSEHDNRRADFDP
jgi:hypothetical protein